MNVNVKFTGIIEEILDAAIRVGMAKDRTEALRMSVLELDHHYRLLEREAELQEEAEDVRDAKEFLKKLGKNEAKLHSEEEIRKALRS
ncbi:hypothetical protein HY992_04710 [Candidatus Micrarchaeota archaeon]|nr:hypothetical protein [Candidatus Micrarchaeota archaeon]